MNLVNQTEYGWPKVTHDNGASVKYACPTCGSRMGSQRSRILSAIGNGIITGSEIADALALTPQAADNHLLVLVERGLAARVRLYDGGPHYAYGLTQAGRQVLGQDTNARER